MSNITSKKITSPKQFNVLLEFLELHSEMVTGSFVTANSRTKNNDLWKKLAEKLNAEGPPSRDEEGWKKVWADTKNKIKTKLRRFHIERAKTGGGINNIKFSEFDNRIIDLCSMRTAVLGIADGKDFGAATNEDSEIFPVNEVGLNEENVSQCSNQKPKNIEKRLRPTTQSRVLKELQEQGKANTDFRKELIALLKEGNDINRQRLDVEKKILSVKESNQTINFV